MLLQPVAARGRAGVTDHPAVSVWSGNLDPAGFDQRDDGRGGQVGHRHGDDDGCRRERAESDGQHRDET